MSALRGKKRDRVLAIAKLRKKIAKLQEEEKLLVNTLKTEIDYGSYSCGDYIVEKSHTERKNLDKVKLYKELGKKADKYYCKITEIIKLSISLKKA